MMSAYNIVRFRVKRGCDDKIIQAHRHVNANFPGFIRGSLIKTGERSYCMIGEWDKQSSIDAAENEMIGVLDSFRDSLENLGSGLGVTDPIAGEVLVELESETPYQRKSSAG